MKEIFERASVRVFKAQPVESEKIEALLKAGMQAPSAGNQQEWEFLVVQSKETLEKLAGVDNYARFLSRVPAAIIVMGNRNEMRFPEHWQQDLSAASENILLQSVSEGLASVWLGVAPIEERMHFITQLFDLPDNILPFGIIAVGYAKTVPEIEPRYNPERVHYEKY